MLNLPEIVVTEDICVMISTEKKAKVKNFPPMKFRFWLNAKWIKERAGVNTLGVDLPLE